MSQHVRGYSSSRVLLKCFCLVLLGLASGCVQTKGPSRGPVSAPEALTEVVVLGMIHSGHRKSEVYGIDKIQEIVRTIDPDLIFCEIPPGRLEGALAEYRETGKITEPRVKVFPEYVDAIIPLMESTKFEMVPCAAWTKSMADARRAKLEAWKTERPEESAEVTAAQRRASEAQHEEGLSEDPLEIHTQRYDELVKQGMEPYDRLFNEDLGDGGWTNINAAHFDLIARALDTHRGKGRRVLITFGSWHKYWFLEALAKRNDVKIRNLSDFIGQ